MSKMSNETEFVLSQDLSKGFTVISNELYDLLSDGAVGLYGRIIRRANIPGWKVYQSTLINTLNKRSAVTKNMNELISMGYIEKTQLRDDKGRIKGVKYVVHATPIKKGSNVEPIGNTTVKPNAKKPKSDLPKSEKRHLKTKEEKKEKTKEKKDTTTIVKSKTKVSEKSSSSTIDSLITFSLELKNITKTNIKRLELNQDEINLLEEYVINNEFDNIDKFSYYIAKQIKSGTITKESLKASKSNKKVKTTVNDKITTFRKKDYDYDDLERKLLGWEEDDDCYENDDATKELARKIKEEAERKLQESKENKDSYEDLYE